MDRERLPAVPRVRGRPVPRLFATLVRHPQSPPRRRMDDAGPPVAQHVAKLLPARPARRLGRLPHLRGGVMKICILTPAPVGSRKGNRITAVRWARLLSDLG